MAPTPLTNTAVQSESVNPMQKFAIGVWLVELTIYFSRFFDQVAAGYHVPALVLFLLIFTSVMSGRLLKGFPSKAGRMMLMFWLWISFTTPLGIWRSNSLSLYAAFLVSLLYFAVISGVVASPKDLRQNMITLAIALLMAAGLSFVFGANRQERFELEVGTYHDPNQYAMCLLIGIPLWWYIAVSAKSAMVKMFAIACTIPIFFAFLRAGSRGGLLGLGAILFILFLQSSMPKKFALIAGISVAVLGAAALMPGYLKTRYMTSLGSDSVQVDDKAHTEYLQADINSAQSRKLILIKSFEVTLEHPLMGVGLNNFPVAVYADAKQGGKRYDWLVTHNSYTQISTETGIPGLLIFLTMIFYAFQSLSQVHKLTGPRSAQPQPEIWNIAKYLRLSLAGACVCMFFLSVAFTPEIYVLVGLTIALERVARQQVGPVTVAAPVGPQVGAQFAPRPRMPLPPRPPFPVAPARYPVRPA